MNFSFHPEAETEFVTAIQYYEEQERELGLDFSMEVYKSVTRILANPESWTKVSNSIRRILVQRFPFGVLYHYNSETDHVFIVAVMHLRREPGYWKERLE